MKSRFHYHNFVDINFHGDLIMKIIDREMESVDIDPTAKHTYFKLSICAGSS